MGLIKQYYKWRHPGVPEEMIPARYNIYPFGQASRNRYGSGFR